MRYTILIGTLLLAVAGYTIYWFVLASETEDAITGWAARMSERGYDVEITNLSMGGYPFRLIGRIDRLTGRIPTPARPVGWESRDLDVVAEPWSDERLQLIFNGDQIVDVPVDAGLARYRVTAENARAAIRRPVAPIAGLDLSMEQAAVTAAATEARLTAEQADLHLRRTQPDDTANEAGGAGAAEAANTSGDSPALPATARLTLRVQNMTLPEDQGGILGRNVAAIEAEAALHGMLNAVTPAALTQWAESGGTLEVTGMALSWGPFQMKAAGTLTLDSARKPLGAFQTRVKGLRDLINALTEQDRLKAEYADLARTALAAMEDPKDDGWIRVPFTLQNGQLYMGPIPLIALPTIGES